MQFRHIAYDSLSSYALAHLLPRVSETLVPLSHEYPGFCSWYNSKVLTGLLTGDRSILISTDNDELTGIAILKHEKREKKICTLRIVSEFRGQGHGSALIGKARQLLRTDYPLITVPSPRLAEFEPVLRRYDFELAQRLPDHYIEGQTEYVFNGLLSVVARRCAAGPLHNSNASSST